MVNDTTDNDVVTDDTTNNNGIVSVVTVAKLLVDRIGKEVSKKLIDVL